MSQAECGGDDCDDSDADRFPGNPEVCDPEGHDEDCDPASFGTTDADGDGFVSSACCNGDACGDDCDDADTNRNPGAVEACNARDDDCDGAVDESGAFCPIGTCVERRCRATSWERIYGAGGFDSATDVTTDHAGNVYFTVGWGQLGDLDGDGEADASGAYIVSVSAEGRHRWHTRALARIAMASDDASLMAIGSDGLIQRLSASDGSVLQTRTLAPPVGWSTIDVVGISQSGRGFVVAAALRPGDTGILLARLDGLGETVDQRIVDAEGYQEVRAVAATVDGVVLAGRTRLPLDLGTGPIEESEFVAKLSADLETCEWHVAMPSYAVQVSDVALSETGEVAIVGNYNTAARTGDFEVLGVTWPDTGRTPDGFDDTDAYAISLAPDGSHRWTRLQRGGYAEYFTDVSYDGRGGILVGGQFSGTLDLTPRGVWPADGRTDAFYAVWDALDRSFTIDGRVFSGAGSEAVRGVTADAFGAFLVAGSFDASITLVTGSTHTTIGATDGFLVRSATID